MKPVVIIGGGITGLAVAYGLEQRGLPYLLLEASSRWGGKIRTMNEDGLVIEAGPDAFGTHLPEALNLSRELGLGERLVAPATRANRVSVWDRGRLRPVPEGMMQMSPTGSATVLRSNLVSWPGKLRMGWDYFIPPSFAVEDESLAHFVRRRLGREAADRIAAPLLAGIHAADPEELSLLASFPRFRQMEQTHGGLVRAWLAQRRQPGPRASAARPFLLAPAGGMQELVDGLVARLPPERRRLETSVSALEPVSGGWQVILGEGRDEGERLVAEHVVCAAPAFAAAALVAGFDPGLAADLREIRYTSLTSVVLAYRLADTPGRVRGRSFMVNPAARCRIRACTWISDKFPQRAPEGVALLRVALRPPPNPDASDDELMDTARGDLAALLGIRARPIYASTIRLPQGIPFLRVGHPGRVERIEHRLGTHRGLHLAGAAYHGAGVPQCLASARRALDVMIGVLPSRPVDAGPRS